MMDGDDYAADPFSSDGLWRISQFTLQSLQPLDPLPWDEGLPDLARGVFKSPLDLFGENGSELHQLDIPDLDLSDSDGPSESTTDVSNHSQHDPDTGQQNEEELENIWALDSLNTPPTPQNALKSWEKYEDRSHCEPTSAYFSEWGARGFDAVLARQKSKIETSGSKRIARNDHFFRSIFRLGLGWSSMFFRYNEQKAKFERVFGDSRLLGISLTALNGLVDEILQCGTDMQTVRNFVSKTPSHSDYPSALSAISSAAAVVLYTLEAQLVRNYKHTVSILRIKSLFQQCGEIIGALADIIESIKGATTESQIISIVLARAAQSSQNLGHTESLFREIAARVISPFLDHVETWVGFRPETPTLNELARSGRSFVGLADLDEKNKPISKMELAHYTYHPGQMPSFIPGDQARLIFESGRSLRLLRRFHPRHPISSGNISHPRLGCASSWAEIERIQNKAQAYEKILRAEILKYNREGPSEKEDIKSTPERSILDGDKALSEAFDLFDLDNDDKVTGLLTKSSLERDTLSQLLDSSPIVQDSADDGTAFAPELTSSLYLSMAPLLSSQASLIDYSCLHMLFKEHKLRYHLTLQWRFQLLGDGFFASRLSHSLFDPEMKSGERKTGAVRSGVHAGLRLGSRDSWPPASSELRLVLMGLLDECYSADDQRDDTENIDFRKEKELPGGLSFSIRELTDEEIAKCKDPDTIEALDFLRLQYKPSDVLGAVITYRSLAKYDRLFKHLLRLLRMVSVVKGLVRDSTARNSLSGDTRNVFQKFRIDCQHFVLCLSDYCFHVGVGSVWRRFQDALAEIESCLDKGDFDGTIEAAHSVSSLRDSHEDILDQMLFALFLSKRHSEAAKLLENIFGTILAFAPLSRIDGMRGVRHESETTVYRLYALFRKQTSAFVEYLRELDDSKAGKTFSRSGMAFASRETPVVVFDHLLARLDVKKYY
ncbi:Spc98 family-domain-containing protein [Aspergillus ambiguus]|uniref:tubulin gamma complex associated family protein n=1 Tax=Aspergillus ambiguus TaxID=176160 RepID=UPI003CCD150D